MHEWVTEEVEDAAWLGTAATLDGDRFLPALAKLLPRRASTACPSSQPATMSADNTASRVQPISTKRLIARISVNVKHESIILLF